MSHRYLAAAFLLAAAVASLGCDNAKYEVKGTGTATITYRDGDLKTVKDAPLPWSMEVGGSKLELQAKGTGQLECSIRIPGKGVSGEFGDGKCKTSTSR
ncbi:MAG: hypothetical protein QM820_33700 [Minicystis sp.]